MSNIGKAELDAAFKTLQENTSIQVVSNFLKSRDFTWSANSWDSLIKQRLLPPINSGAFDRGDLVALLRSVEEHGRQHVLLYRLQKHIAQQLMNEERVKAYLKKFDIVELYETPKIVDLPTGQLLVDIRHGRWGKQRELVIKAVEGRIYRRLLSRKTEGNFETLVYENYRQRAVNVVRILEDGSTEVRVQSHRRVIDYEAAAESLLNLCLPLFDRMHLVSVPLSDAKLFFASKPRELRSRVRFGNGLFKNRKGGGMSVSTGHEQQDLYEDEGAIDGTAAYMKKNDGYCEEATLFWKPKVENLLPSTELHTFMAGAVNEFALTSQCDQADYEYVLEQITRANRKR